MSETILPGNSDLEARESERPPQPSATLPYLGEAVPIGLAGAGVVAGLVLILDWLAGTPLATPNVLGARLLRGAALTPAAPIQPELVFGYTLLHAVTFIALAAGAISAATALSARGVSFQRQLAFGLPALFVALQATFFALLLLIHALDGIPLDFVKISTVNAIASIVMGFAVMRRIRSRDDLPSEA